MELPRNLDRMLQGSNEFVRIFIQNFSGGHDARSRVEL